MQSTTFARAALAAAGIVLAAGFAAPAAAQTPQTQATTTGNLYLRTAPGTANEAIAVMPANATVDVYRCTLEYRWCEVSYDGRQGWAGSAYLAIGGQPLITVAQAQNMTLIDYDPSEPFGGTPAAGPPAEPPPSPPISETPPMAETPPVPRVPAANEVCFFPEPRYAGTPFCATMGQSDRVLGADWDNQIASIRVGANALVEACVGRNYGGPCFVFSGYSPALPASLQAGISSFRTVGIPTAGSYARVCFFTDVRFAGDMLCASPGEDDRVIAAAFNDEVSSFLLSGGASVTVCADRNYGGRCEDHNYSLARLLPALDNAISSYQVR